MRFLAVPLAMPREPITYISNKYILSLLAFAVLNSLEGLPDEIKQMILNTSYLIKFKGISYLHC